MPYARLSGQVTKVKLKDHYVYDSFGYRAMVGYTDAEVTIRLDGGQVIKLTCLPEDSGAWIAERVNVVITTKEDR